MIEEYEQYLTDLINEAWNDGDTQTAFALHSELVELRALREFVEMDCS